MKFGRHIQTMAKMNLEWKKFGKVDNHKRLRTRNREDPQIHLLN
jgi:hypothetical protein